MPSVPKRTGLNAAKTMSALGKAELARSEGLRLHAYNDIAKNCTVGAGVLIHKGICSPQELVKNYDVSYLNQEFNRRLHEAERYVRFYVRDADLGQARFDALTSFTFNVGVGNAKDALNLANHGNNSGVAQEMKLNVNIRVKGKDGKIHLIKSAGLISRREREASPFGLGSGIEGVQ